ncbi:hypothetical protein [Aquimarina sp. AD10]|uniref:hypothetical protein n=1 Tax=Aquimarina sp. AD10 TaxID=1714849 RepID=UPI000EA8517A|nr:hypothetical protein [Aquimarina sp. AD10]RKM92167.1 hypothetical protein D7033_21370 [Aquimarina sp. AD10]
MKFIKNTFFFLISLISLIFFYYLLAFVFILFESLSDLWIVILSVIGGGIVGLITTAYSMLLDKLIPSSKLLNWVFIAFNLVLGIFNIQLHWQIDVGLIARVFYALIISGVCLMIIRSRLLVTDN